MKPLFNAGGIVLVQGIGFRGQGTGFSPEGWEQFGYGGNLRGKTRKSYLYKFLTFSLWPSAFGLSPGDCVVYNFGGRNLLHRIIKIDSNGVWIQDDGEVISAHFVKWQDIRGRVISKNPLKNGFPGSIYFNLKSFYRNTRRSAVYHWKALLENPEKS